MDEPREICERLVGASRALSVTMLDENGRAVVHAGEELDLEALSTLFPGGVSAGGLARLIEEREISGNLAPDGGTHVHLALIARRRILVVTFNAESSLGLVRLRAKKAVEELERVFE